MFEGLAVSIDFHSSPSTSSESSSPFPSESLPTHTSVNRGPASYIGCIWFEEPALSTFHHSSPNTSSESSPGISLNTKSHKLNTLTHVTESVTLTALLDDISYDVPLFVKLVMDLNLGKTPLSLPLLRHQDLPACDFSYS
ncbi:hypothetical protein CDL12_07419 [Handroanthus impetiginosus]|uniref:Uncharacterized protein n=1 Tax=Handroanthus impetiginosus TaxID=429701 RepID=A0A2G9HQU6_9LAMI|nr:hypothetical protein CDL12_07419 [Handroanthus impetiginosus]